MHQRLSSLEVPRDSSQPPVQRLVPAPPLCWFSRLPGSKQAEHSGRPVFLGILSELGSGNCWSQTTPLQRDSRGSPQSGWGKLDGTLRSQDERTA